MPAFKLRLSFNCDADVQTCPGTTDILCLVFGVGLVEDELTQLNASLLIHMRVLVSLGLHSYSMLLNLLPN